jgi:hypothetical protein
MIVCQKGLRHHTALLQSLRGKFWSWDGPVVYDRVGFGDDGTGSGTTANAC